MGLLIGIGNTKPEFPYDHFYGVEWDATVSNPTCKRIGKVELHKELPIQSLMRRCVVGDDGNVKYYLDANDSTKKDTGSPARLDGTDGMVMVELPEVYIKFETQDNIRRCLISQYPLPGFLHWDKNYVSAYEASLDRSTGKLASVVSEDPNFRGGTNESSWDGTYRSLLGMPLTLASLTNFRSYASKRGEGWYCYQYMVHLKLWWLFVVEYATLNSQLAFNAEPTSEGFKQGGLGVGITTWSWAAWDEHNGRNPFCKLGMTNSLGNKSGEVEFKIKKGGTEEEISFNANSYRGVENPFGHVWKWTDGCKTDIEPGDDGKSRFFVVNDPKNCADGTYDNYEYRGELSRREGYIKDILFGAFGDVLATEVGAGYTTYYCDYFYTDIKQYTGERGVLFGGSSQNGAYAGFVLSNVYNSPSTTSAAIGSRLCFIPNRKD